MPLCALNPCPTLLGTGPNSAIVYLESFFILWSSAAKFSSTATRFSFIVCWTWWEERDTNNSGKTGKTTEAEFRETLEAGVFPLCWFKAAQCCCIPYMCSSPLWFTFCQISALQPAATLHWLGHSTGLRLFRLTHCLSASSVNHHQGSLAILLVHDNGHLAEKGYVM